jgi:hypothetical protein
MKPIKLFAVLLCAATLLSGCGTVTGSTTNSTGSTTAETESKKPLSKLEELTLQTQEWEKAGTYDDEKVYREALLTVAGMVQAEDQGTYRCDDPSQLDEAKLAALTDAGIRCNYAYSFPVDSDPFSEEFLPSTIGMLMLYTPGDLEYTTCWNMQGDDPSVPPGNYCYVKKDAIEPFLAETVEPAAQAFREYEGDLSAWNWYEGEDGYIYVNVTGLTATLPYSEPDFTSVEPLGGNRYLVVCDMLPVAALFKYQMAYVVEDVAQPGATPHVVVLDCVSGMRRDGNTVDWDAIEALKTKYRVLSKDGQQALDLLARLEALSPIPFHTNLAVTMSPATEQALEDAKNVYDMLTEDTFESYVIALFVHPAMHRYSPEEEWTPAEPGHETYGEEWNRIPAAELEAAFQQRFGIDLTANDRSWLENPDFVPCDTYTEGPMASFDGEYYNVYLRGVGSPMWFPHEISLIYHYDGTYTAIFTKDTSERFPESPYSITTLHLRNVGTQEEPFFQLVGYELPK